MVLGDFGPETQLARGLIGVILAMLAAAAESCL
jgi:hypothetical protein